jgi:hypothetical protein
MILKKFLIAGLVFCLVLTMVGCGGGGGKKAKVEATVYVAGYYNDGTIDHPCYWEGTNRRDLPGDGVHQARAYDIFLAGGIVYTTGYYNNGSNKIPCYWEGTTRHNLEDSSVRGESYSIFIADGKVYTSGYYRDAGGKNVPCYWEGTTRHDLPCSNSGVANTIFVSGSVVYTAGYYNDGRTKACYWQGTDSCSDLPHDNNGEAESVYFADGKIYFSGYYTDLEGKTSTPCYWVCDEGIISRCDLPGSGKGEGDASMANEIKVINDKIYTVGSHYDGVKTVPCYWVGTNRYDLDGGGGYAGANSIFITNGMIYIAGYYCSGGFIKNACYWRGDQRYDLPGDGGHESCARAIFVQ